MLAEEEVLAFDRAAAAWVWDIDRIEAKDYTDNVVDLVVRKLRRLPLTAQDALKHLACLGNMAEIGALSMCTSNQRRRWMRRCGKLSMLVLLSIRVALQVPARPDTAGSVFIIS